MPLFIAATQFPVARLIQAVMDSVPANVHVEINQNAPIGFESQIEIQPHPQSANSTGTTAASGASETGEFCYFFSIVFVFFFS